MSGVFFDVGPQLMSLRQHISQCFSVYGLGQLDSDAIISLNKSDVNSGCCLSHNSSHCARTETACESDQRDTRHQQLDAPTPHLQHDSPAPKACDVGIAELPEHSPIIDRIDCEAHRAPLLAPAGSSSLHLLRANSVSRFYRFMTLKTKKLIFYHSLLL
jgi:hypothetical protein